MHKLKDHDIYFAREKVKKKAETRTSVSSPSILYSLSITLSSWISTTSPTCEKQHHKMKMRGKLLNKTNAGVKELLPQRRMFLDVQATNIRILLENSGWHYYVSRVNAKLQQSMPE